MLRDSTVQDGTTFDSPATPEGPPPLVARLAVVGGQAPRVVEVSEGRDLSMGRSRSCDLVIEDRAASRLHATLRWHGGETIALTDHGSRNGTIVDGKRVEGTVELTSGSEIGVGAVRIVVSIPRPPIESEHPSGPIDDGDLVAIDPIMVAVVGVADRAAASDVSVLLEGETGVGKELIARRIHARSKRASGPFVATNCGSIAEALAESTFFGHERGAFTDATARRVGLFEAASGGTLFLDEVGELAPSVQSRLLRALEQREVLRVGATEPVPVDVRIIAATNRDLAEMVRARAFREDLLYRLDVLRITIPPLRRRPDDVLALARRFLRDLGGKRKLSFSPDAVEALRAHAWPGNVRELRNVVERAVTMCTGDAVSAGDLFETDAPGRGGALRSQMHDIERDAIAEALSLCDGNQTKAAERLGISRRALIYKMERLGLKPMPPSKS